jgi:hypothetical protein
VGQQFLEESASQLTYHGLCELNAKMGDGELAVFFRNNHFSTIYKQVTLSTGSLKGRPQVLVWLARLNCKKRCTNAKRQ